jgi:DHA1 family bicyclomycin/chloramphenicol resistance-like MFS transporter
MTQLVLSRLLQALGGCAGIVIARAVVRDSYEPRNAARVFSTLIMISAAAPILAPTVGGWIVQVGNWRIVFWAQATFGAVLLTAIHFVLPETRQAGHTAPLRVSSTLQNYLVLIKDRHFIGHVLMGTFAVATIFCYISGAPIVLTETYGISAHSFGWIMSLSGLSLVLANQLNIFRLRRHSPRAILRVAVWMPLLLGIFTVTVLSLFALPAAWVVLLQLSTFIAIGHILPNVAAEALAQRGEDAGTASALMGSVQSLGSTAAGFAVAAANDGSMRTIAILMAVCGALMLLVKLTLVRRPAQAL